MCPIKIYSWPDTEPGEVSSLLLTNFTEKNREADFEKEFFKNVCKSLEVNNLQYSMKKYSTKVLVSFQNNTPTGFLKYYYPSVHKRDQINIDALWIEPTFRRQGLAKKLLTKVNAGQPCKIELCCLNHDCFSPAHIFYKKEGFTEIYTEARSIYENISFTAYERRM